MTERLYEGLFLVDAAEATQDWTTLESFIRGIIDQNGCVIEHAEKWPEQRLAYDVNGVKRGVYYLTYFRGDSQAVAPIRSDAQLSEKILRFLVIQEPFLEDEMSKRKEAAARKLASSAPAAAEKEDASEKNEVASDPPEESNEADNETEIESVVDEVPADAGEPASADAAEEESMGDDSDQDEEEKN